MRNSSSRCSPRFGTPDLVVLAQEFGYRNINGSGVFVFRQTSRDGHSQ